MWPLLDCQFIIDSLASSTIFTGLDIKAGFHNIPLSERVSNYTVCITQDGKFRAKRMLFGMKSAPAHFQRAITLTLDLQPNGKVVVYIDDIIISGNTWQEVWNKTLDTLKKLTDAGFMINMNKCHFLATTLEAVGFEVASGKYKPKLKKL